MINALDDLGALGVTTAVIPDHLSHVSRAESIAAASRAQAAAARERLAAEAAARKIARDAAAAKFQRQQAVTQTTQYEQFARWFPQNTRLMDYLHSQSAIVWPGRAAAAFRRRPLTHPQAVSGLGALDALDDLAELASW